MFLVTTCWRGSLNIGDMRNIAKKTDALKYYAKLKRRDTLGTSKYHGARCYKISSIKDPILLWSYSREPK
mgnify:CR=1 FL=1